MFWESTFTTQKLDRRNPKSDYPESDFMLRKCLCPSCGMNRMQETSAKDRMPRSITCISFGAVAEVNY